jgi:hypothetical protein
MDAAKKLEAIKRIIDQEEISCAEDLWQRADLVEEKLPIILEKICAIAGWYEVK